MVASQFQVKENLYAIISLEEPQQGPGRRFSASGAIFQLTVTWNQCVDTGLCTINAIMCTI